MQYQIENEIMRIGVDTHGAELSTMLHLPTGREYLWQGDPDVWPRRSPLLFPYCGQVAGGRFFLEGREYTGGRHGFARDMEHHLVTQAADRLIFALESSPETGKLYPYEFRLETSYHLEGNRLTCTMSTTNSDRRTMYFSAGFHTGINLPFVPGTSIEQYCLTVEAPEELRHLAGNETSVEEGLFMEVDGLPQTLMVKDPISTYSQITETTSGDYVRVYHPGVPYLVLWSCPPKKAKLICIEPWHGISDMPGQAGDFSRKDAIIALAPGETRAISQVLEFGVQ